MNKSVSPRLQQSSSISTNPKKTHTHTHTHTHQQQNATLSSTSAITTTPKTTFTSSKILTTHNKSSFNGIRISSHPTISLTTSRKQNQPSGAGVIMMATREEENKVIRAKTTEEINDEILDLRGELTMLHRQKSAGKVVKSSEFHRMRKRIQRMVTVKREREIEDGIDERMSRMLFKQWSKRKVPRPPPSLKKLREEEAAEDDEFGGDDDEEIADEFFFY